MCVKHQDADACLTHLFMHDAIRKHALQIAMLAMGTSGSLSCLRTWQLHILSVALSEHVYKLLGPDVGLLRTARLVCASELMVY